ncbi:MAG: D-2-hydroxyacid dehydrogenase family protein, partial [Bradyrhizobium sp.]|nr:D-2-hydroxyacid dehydrogenase family protein [Bradyrhizobium sp.]
MTRLRCAILDDYYDKALALADWRRLADKVDVTAFTHPFGSEDAAAGALADIDIVCAMRERTPFPRTLIERL